MLQVDSSGNDLSEPANVRYFLMSSLPHNGGVPTTGRGICRQERNPLVANSVLRALLVDMDEWVSAGTPPPESQMPRVADGTLVPALPQDNMGFPSIPSVVYNGRAHTGDLFDFDPQFDQGILSILPPKLLGTPYPLLVPKTDADGNDIAGVRLPDVAAPLATYTGWGLRAIPSGANDGCDAAGQIIALAPTAASRAASGDPRPINRGALPDTRRVRGRCYRRREWTSRAAAPARCGCSGVYPLGGGERHWKMTVPARLAAL